MLIITIVLFFIIITLTTIIVIIITALITTSIVFITILIIIIEISSVLTGPRTLNLRGGFKDVLKAAANHSTSTIVTTIKRPDVYTTRPDV